MRLALPPLLILAMLLSGCDMLGIEGAAAVGARKEAEGKAVGGACRHAGRALEDCYAMNKRTDKAAVFAGWREMNDYMRENKIEEVKPEFKPAAAASAPADAAGEPAKEAKEEKIGKAGKAGKGGKGGA